MLLSFTRAGALPLGKIGERLQVHRTSVTNIVDKLEADGLVRRVPHTEDRRATLAEITDAGRETARRRDGRPQRAAFGIDAAGRRRAGAPSRRCCAPCASTPATSSTAFEAPGTIPVRPRYEEVRLSAMATTYSVPRTEAEWREAYALTPERDGAVHDALGRAGQAALHRGRPAATATDDRPPRRLSVHARRVPEHVPRAAVDDAPVRRLRHGRGDQRALPLPARPRPDRPEHGVRHALADGPRLRPRRARWARSGARASRSTRSTTWRRCSPGIDLGEVSVSMTINAPAAIMLAYYVVAAEEQGRRRPSAWRARSRPTSSRSTSPRRSGASRSTRRCGCSAT